MSMAAGEYISEHLQADTEKADLSRERSELESDPRTEPRELTAFSVARGLTRACFAVCAHARDEFGISAALSARPIQAALAPAICIAWKYCSRPG